MEKTQGRVNPLISPLALIVAGLAFSVGWGIRGNYGHETGAMFPGALGAIVVSLASRRRDWQQRVIYFALFGMLGWAFGGSISYMQVIGYTHSGQSATQIYGYLMLFLIGFLWAGLGGAGTALPAELDLKTLRQSFGPLCAALAAWCLMFFGMDWVLTRTSQWWAEYAELDGMNRHEGPLYWLDSDWLEVSTVLSFLLLYALARAKAPRPMALLGSIAVGGLIGYGFFFVIAKVVGNEWFETYLVQVQGIGSEATVASERLAVTNWPPLLLDLARRPGILFDGEIIALGVGSLSGLAFYFWRYVEFDFPTRLFVAMAVGWWIAFLLLPVLGSLFLAKYGGLRMTPPRGDNWAGILGTLVAVLLVCWRQGYRGIVVAALICGSVGGVGFSGAAWAEAMLVAPGNRSLQVSQEVWQHWQAAEGMTVEVGEPIAFPDELANLQNAESWQHWHGQNWHSFLEQSYGFVNGLAVMLGLAPLVSRVSLHASEKSMRDWTLEVSLVMVLPVLIYVNMIKNLRAWQDDGGPGGGLLPSEMVAPWIDITFSLDHWFDIFYFFATLCFVGALLASRSRRPAIWPGSWLGRGQMLLLVMLWCFVVGNWTRAMPGFTAQRLLTEGITLVSALLVSCLSIFLTPASVEPKPAMADNATEPKAVSWAKPMWGALVLVLLLGPAVPLAEWWSLRRVYGDGHTTKRGFNYRFGPYANWHHSPLFKGDKHR